jgi:hypothetical protein
MGFIIWKPTVSLSVIHEESDPNHLKLRKYLWPMKFAVGKDLGYEKRKHEQRR